MDRWVDNRRRWPALVVASVAVGWFAGCAPTKPSDGDAQHLEVEAADLGEIDDREAIVARVDGEAISRQEFHRRLEAMEEFAQVRFQSPQRRGDLLTGTIAFELLADEAERRGYGAHAQVRRAIKHTMAERYLDERISQTLTMAAIGEDERRQYFEDRGHEFDRPERRRLARLWVDDQGRAQQLIDQWHREAPAGAEERMRSFQRFAFLYSQDRQTGDFGGRSDWYRADDDELIVDDLFDREPAALHGPIAIDGGFALEMVVDVEEAHRPSLAEVEQAVARRLYDERRARRRAEIIDGLMAQAQIEIFEDRLEQVEPPPDEAVLRLGDVPRQGHEPGH